MHHPVHWNLRALARCVACGTVVVLAASPAAAQPIATQSAHEIREGSDSAAPMVTLGSASHARATAVPQASIVPAHGMAMHAYSHADGVTPTPSPGLAAALSLTPLPVDFGNLYVGDIGWAMACTAVEVSIMAPGMWFLGQHMGHGDDADGRWSSTEQGLVIGLLAGYVAVKVVAGLHAASVARDLNAAQAGWHARPNGILLRF